MHAYERSVAAIIIAVALLTSAYIASGGYQIASSGNGLGYLLEKRTGKMWFCSQGVCSQRVLNTDLGHQ